MIVNDPSIVAELTELAERYETALMTNDLPALDAMFWQSTHVVRFGISENLYGIESIAAFRAARPGGSPPRQVIRTTIASFGRDTGVINIEFQRIGAVAGRHSQSWVRLAEGWRIVAAHVSLMACAAEGVKV
jgi:hypothetical protein